MKLKIAIIVILIILLAGGLFGLNYIRGLDSAFDQNNTERTIVDIPMGSSTSDIADILVENGIIGSANKFKLFSRMNNYDGRYVAGGYELSPSMTPKEICEKIVSGDVAAFRFTIPEGYTVEEIVDTIAATGHADKTKLLDVINNGDFSEYEFLNHVPDGAHPLEGYLYPETYIMPYGSTEEDIIKAMLDRFQTIWDEETAGIEQEWAWEGPESIHGILTIASIIEKETIHLEDKPLVSSVIYNRLEDGMPLRMDTTVIYAMGEHKVDLTYDDIEIESPYNTYLHEGLPIGPICSPSLDSIKAALNPADTNYYYFVVSDKGDGSIKFSENDWEFEEDKAAYYASREDDEDN